MTAKQLLCRIETLSAKYDREMERMEQMRDQLNDFIAEFESLEVKTMHHERYRQAAEAGLRNLSFQFSGMVGTLQDASYAASQLEDFLSDIIG
jgi:hypothetical protein